MESVSNIEYRYATSSSLQVTVPYCNILSIPINFLFALVYIDVNLTMGVKDGSYLPTRVRFGLKNIMV